MLQNIEEICGVVQATTHRTVEQKNLQFVEEIGHGVQSSTPQKRKKNNRNMKHTVDMVDVDRAESDPEFRALMSRLRGCFSELP